VYIITSGVWGYNIIRGICAENLAIKAYSRSDPKTTPDPNKKLFSPQHYIILIPLIRNSAFDYTNRFPFSEFKNNI
jgi:hypothetical protein